MGAMELTVHLYEGWKPRIIPAGSRRDWMDQSPDSFAYRCLPLKIANEHGWELLCPVGFEAEWNGGSAPEDVVIRVDPGGRPEDAPVALFGEGTLTFHVQGLFRTPPGINLWVGGSPNEFKDGIGALSGIIETDWSPYTFTMNWKFTRPGHVIRFEENEPFCYFFPLQRGLVSDTTARLAPIDEAPELKRQFETWSQSRDAFHEEMRVDPPSETAARWQKLYYRGLDAQGVRGTEDHQTKIRACPFESASSAWQRRNVPTIACPANALVPAPAAQPTESSANELMIAALKRDLAKRNWFLSTQERLLGLSEQALGIAQLPNIDAASFLNDFYARNRPLILTQAISDWPALQLWTPDYLKARIGDRLVEYQTGRDSNENYELDKDRHARTGPFDDFIDQIDGVSGNNLYLTAYNSRRNTEALAPLGQDMGFLDALMQRGGQHEKGMMWIGPAGTYTPPHHDLTNNLLIQLVGRKRVVLVAPNGTPRLYNDHHVFSSIHDLSAVDTCRYPQAEGLAVVEIDLSPGEILFIPIGWWHQVLALDFSVSVTQTNFIWMNNYSENYPA